MMNKSKLTALTLLVIVFIAGGAAGWGTREATDKDPRGRGRGPDAMVDFLGRELKLSGPQRDSVRAIFVRHRPEMDALWREVRPRFDSIKARVRTEIDSQLTPEQRERHQRLIEDAEHRRRGDSTKAGGGGGDR